MSVRQACILLNISSSVYHYRPKPRNDQSIITALEDLAEGHSRWGFWMMYGNLPLLSCRLFKKENHLRMDILKGLIEVIGKKSSVLIYLNQFNR